MTVLRCTLIMVSVGSQDQTLIHYEQYEQTAQLSRIREQRAPERRSSDDGHGQRAKPAPYVDDVTRLLGAELFDELVQRLVDHGREAAEIRISASLCVVKYESDRQTRG